MKKQANPHHNPANLLNHALSALQVKTDAALGRKIGASPSQISKMRSGGTVSAAHLVAIHDATGISIGRLRYLMGDYRPHTGQSARHPNPDELDAIHSRGTSVPSPQSHPFIEKRFDSAGRSLTYQTHHHHSPRSTQ